MSISCTLRIESRLLAPDGLIERGAVLMAGEHIAWAGARDHAPAHPNAPVLQRPRWLAAPGFWDLHVHGGGGADASDGAGEAIATMARVHALHGTTSLCPTVLATAPEETLRALETIRQAAQAPPPGGARIVGAHLEGPFLNPRRAGAQPVEYLRLPDRALVDELLAAGGPALRIVTLAPELPGALRIIERLVEAGVVVGMGHTEATFAQAQRAVAAGCRLGVHLFNAMSGVHHREMGAAGAVLLHPQVTAELICDGLHVSPPAMDLAWRLKGPERLALVTDCTAALGAPAGQRLGQRAVTVRDGAVRLDDGTLAGSVLTQDRAVRNLVRHTSAAVADALAAASHVPAALLGQTAHLCSGAPADLVLLDDALMVRAVYVAGRPILSVEP